MVVGGKTESLFIHFGSIHEMSKSDGNRKNHEIISQQNDRVQLKIGSTWPFPNPTLLFRQLSRIPLGKMLEKLSFLPCVLLTSFCRHFVFSETPDTCGDRVENGGDTSSKGAILHEFEFERRYFELS